MFEFSEASSGCSSLVERDHPQQETCFSDQKPPLPLVATDSGQSANGVLKLPVLSKFSYASAKRLKPLAPARRVLAEWNDASFSRTPESPKIGRDDNCFSGSKRTAIGAAYSGSSKCKSSPSECSDARKRKAAEEPLSPLSAEIQRTAGRGLMEGRRFDGNLSASDAKSRKKVEDKRFQSREDVQDKENVDPGLNGRKPFNYRKATPQPLLSLMRLVKDEKRPKVLLNTSSPGYCSGHGDAIKNNRGAYTSRGSPSTLLDGAQKEGLKSPVESVKTKRINTVGEMVSTNSHSVEQTKELSIGASSSLEISSLDHHRDEHETNEAMSYINETISSKEENLHVESEDKFSNRSGQGIPGSLTSANSTQAMGMVGCTVVAKDAEAKEVSVPVKALSSALSSLTISDSQCQEDLEIPPTSLSVRVQEEVRCVISLSGPMGGGAASMPSPSLSSLGNAEVQGLGGEHAKSSFSSSSASHPASSVPIPVKPCSMMKPSPSHGDALKLCHGNDSNIASSKSYLSSSSGQERVPIIDSCSLSKVGGEKGSVSEDGISKPIPHLCANGLPEKKALEGGDSCKQPRKRWENEHFFWVNGKRYQKLGKIGSGGSSEVYKVIASDCTIYALKRIKLKGRDYSSACGFYQEIEYLEKLQGRRYIIQLVDYEVTDKSFFQNDIHRGHTVRENVFIYMVLEYGEIDLANMLANEWKERSHGGKLDVDWVRSCWKQVLTAVNTIHEERIVHSDLKPANFLVVKGVLKLIDFGIAKAIQSDTTNIVRESHVGTLNYMSPEAFMTNEKDEHGQVVKCGRPSDIWSLGCILYQMVYGFTPFSHITNLWAKVKEITNPNHKIAFPPVSNPYLIDIMKKCLAWNRDDRLRIPQLLEHQFFQPCISPSVPYSKEQLEDAVLCFLQFYENSSDVNILRPELVERLRLFGAQLSSQMKAHM
eukprot:c21548_g1_i1 orf=204-3014(-)